MTLHWIPEPRHIQLTGGYAPLSSSLALDLPRQFPAPLRQAVHELTAFLQRDMGLRLGRGPARSRNASRITIGLTPGACSESYELVVRPGRIDLEAHGAPGIFYGIQTLVQLLRQTGRRPPCLVLRDKPAFADRGFYLDVTRGRVPSLASLKRIIRMLAALKFNQFQLYVEHVFDFRFDRGIGAGSSPLTADEVRELDAYCSDRFIQFVPSLACFGHMGKILSLPKHRACAEAPWPARDWAHATWLQRLRGATINPTLPASRRLIRDMLDEFLPLFSAPFFNMCGDETYDLGVSQRSRRRPIPIPDLYAQHVRFIHDHAARHGKQLMLWGDVLLHYPKAIRTLPRDAIVLDWGYSPRTPFRKVSTFLDAGLDAIVCPSTRGYRVVFNEVEEARGNIAGYARTALRCGARGVLTTDWGDIGHFNMLPCSYHGMALAAAMSWNPRADHEAGFDRAFSQLFGADPTGRLARLYSHAGTMGIGEWPSLIRGLRPDSESAGKAARVRKTAPVLTSCLRTAQSLRPAGLMEASDLTQIRLALDAMRMTAEKTRIESVLAGESGRVTRSTSGMLRELAGDLEAFRRRYADAWLSTCRPSSLRELDDAFKRSVKHLRSVAATRELPPGDPDAFQPLLRKTHPTP